MRQFFIIMVLMTSVCSVAKAERRYDAMYIPQRDIESSPVYTSCDLQNSIFQLHVPQAPIESGKSWDDITSEITEKGLKQVVSALIECDSDSLNVRVKLSQNRFESEGCGSVWKAASIWVNKRKILNTKWYRCTKLESKGYDFPHILQTDISIQDGVARYCQEKNGCEDIHFENTVRDDEEYGQDLLSLELEGKPQLSILSREHTDICERFPDGPNFSQVALQTPENIELSRLHAERHAGFVFLNFDLNGDTDPETIIHKQTVTSRFQGDSIYVFPYDERLGKQALGTIVFDYLDCKKQGQSQVCSIKHRGQKHFQYGSGEYGLPKMNYPISEIVKVDETYTIVTSDMFRDQTFVSLAVNNFNLKPICEFKRVHPNF